MVNRIVLVGRLTRDPQVRRTTSDIPVATLTVAVDDRMKDVNGQKQTLFIDVVVWNNQADNVGKYLRKGSLVGVDGRLRQRQYDRRDGSKATVFEVWADSVQFLEPKDATRETNTEEINQVVEDRNPVDGDHLDSLDVTDDDLPFQKGSKRIMPYKKIRQHKKVCYFTKNKIDCIDYKDVELLKKFITPTGKIASRHSTGTSAKYQRELATAIKNARIMALLPFKQD